MYKIQMPMSLLDRISLSKTTFGTEHEAITALTSAFDQAGIIFSVEGNIFKMNMV